MNIIEQAIALIAPHHCIVCGRNGELLCESCENSSLLGVVSRCFRCHGLSRQSSTCKSCKSTTKIAHVWVATKYGGIVKELIYKYKFHRAKAASKVVARAIDSVLPQLPDDIIICHIPTADSRVRQRGYDQARLIAEHLAKARGWEHRKLLIRRGSSRQVGASREERFKHLEKALKIRTRVFPVGAHILLVDDITTTGATIESAAKVLKSAGAKTVDAAVFAQPE